MASERTLHTALLLFNDSDFRHQRQQEFPGTRPEFDARAAVFAAMDAEGRFDATYGEPMTREEDAEFRVLSGAVIKMSK